MSPRILTLSALLILSVALFSVVSGNPDSVIHEDDLSESSYEDHHVFHDSSSELEDESDDEIERLLSEIDDDDEIYHDAQGGTHWEPATPPEVFDVEVPKCLASIEQILEQQVPIPLVLSEVRHEILSHDEQLASAELIIYNEPTLMDEILQKHSDLGVNCVQYRKNIREAEMKVPCLDAKTKEQDDVRDETNDRIRYGTQLDGFEMLIAYHDLLAICDKAAQELAYAKSNERNALESGIIV